VIEFALLFGLGFLSATLIVMVMAPAVHRRVVRYTENRLKATMPISPAEVRAQRDMARAVYAAENARTKQDLIEERDRATALQIRFDRLAAETTELHAANHDMQMQIDTMSSEAADLRSRLRREEGFILQLKQSLALIESTLEAKNEETDALQKRISRILTDLDDLKISLAARDTELENTRVRTENLREERQTLRSEVKLLTARAKEAETQLQEEKRRLARLDEKLAREIAARTDLATRLERREEELARARGRAKTVKAELWQPVTGNYPLKPINGANLSGLMSLQDTPDDGLDEQTPDQTALEASAPQPAEPAQNVTPMIDLTSFADDIRNRSTALAAQLSKSKSKKAQDALRRELASIAADMVALTAAREGAGSPIPALLAKESDEQRQTGRESLAARARKTYVSLVPPADPGK
jgi:myosin heavy subunit